MSKLRRKKNKIYLANPKEKTIFAPDDESLKRLVAQHRVFFDAFHSKMWNWVRLPIRNPVFPQSPRLPLYKEKQEIFPKLLKYHSLQQLPLAYSNRRTKSKNRTNGPGNPGRPCSLPRLIAGRPLRRANHARRTPQSPSRERPRRYGSLWFPHQNHDRKPVRRRPLQTISRTYKQKPITIWKLALYKKNSKIFGSFRISSYLCSVKGGTK